MNGWRDERYKEAYPYNLINDLVKGKDYYSELDDFKLIQEIESIILTFSDIYARSEHVPKRMQAVMRLYYVNKFTYKEIGEIFGVTGARVGQMKHRALRLMRQPSRFNRLLLKIDSES